MPGKLRDTGWAVTKVGHMGFCVCVCVFCFHAEPGNQARERLPSLISLSRDKGVVSANHFSFRIFLFVEIYFCFVVCVVVWANYSIRRSWGGVTKQLSGYENILLGVYVFGAGYVFESLKEIIRNNCK